MNFKEFLMCYIVVCYLGNGFTLGAILCTFIAIFVVYGVYVCSIIVYALIVSLSEVIRMYIFIAIFVVYGVYVCAIIVYALIVSLSEVIRIYIFRQPSVPNPIYKLPPK
jgi:hypothetical protein